MKKPYYLVLALSLYGCAKSEKVQPGPTVIELADGYVAELLNTFPIVAYYSDTDLEKHDVITSNDLADVRTWEKVQDSLYSELSKIEFEQILDKQDKITYWLLKEELESSMALRRCKENLWNVNHRAGWWDDWLAMAEFQPVGSKELRSQAFERWAKLPKYVETEISNLKTGISEGYTMPKEIVELVIAQLEILINYEPEDSPFMSPAKRDTDKKFKATWGKMVSEQVVSSILSYQNFLKNEYLDAAREDVSILGIPNGRDCYQAFIRATVAFPKNRTA